MPLVFIDVKEKIVRYNPVSGVPPRIFQVWDSSRSFEDKVLDPCQEGCQQPFEDLRASSEAHQATVQFQCLGQRRKPDLCDSIPILLKTQGAI